MPKRAVRFGAALFLKIFSEKVFSNLFLFGTIRMYSYEIYNKETERCSLNTKEFF